MPAAGTVIRQDEAGRIGKRLPLDGSSRQVRGRNRQLWLMGAALVMITVATGGFVIRQSRESALADVNRELTNLGVVLAEHTFETVQAVDVVLKEIQSRTAAPDLQSREQFQAYWEAEDAHRLLMGYHENLRQAFVITVMDANGELLSWSRKQTPQPLDHGDRDYFNWLRDHDDPGAFVGAPVTGRVSGEKIIVIARRLTGPNNEFRGVVTGMINAQYLENFYATISMVPGESVSLLRRDGTVLAGYPDIESRRGMRMPGESPWFDRVGDGGGSYRSPGYLSKLIQIITVHPIRDYPLVVDANMSVDAALLNWRLRSEVVAAATIVVAAGVAILFTVIGAQFRRKDEQHGRLDQAVASSRKSERKLKIYAEMAADWFWEQDADFRFTIDSHIPLTSRSTDIGRTRWEMADPSMDQSRWVPHKEDLVARRPFRDFRWERIRIDGKRRYMSTSGDPIFDDAGTFTGYHGTGRDITADVEAAEALRSAKDRAETATRARSEFLANMSHELRTPLHAIIGFSELIHDQIEGRTNAKYVAWADEVLSNGRKLLGTINAMLELARIDSGRYDILDDKIDLAVVERASRGMFRQQAEVNQVRFDCAIAGADFLLRADRQAIKQILFHLLSNAVRFSHAGGIVRTSVERTSNGDVTLVVADTGVGIEATALASLCEPFTQADSSISRRYDGTGLGLAICHRLASLHGGTLTIESSHGEGTTVRVTFPASRVIAKSRLVFAKAPALETTGVIDG